MTPKRLKMRLDLAWNETQQWRSVLDDAYKLACPERNKFGGVRTPGDEPGNEIFDSTLEHSLTRFANRLQAEMFPVFQDFAKFAPGNTAKVLGPEAVRAVREKSDMATAVCFASIRSSNFSQAINEMLLDLGFGTGCMLVNPMPIGSKDILEFISVNPADMAFDEGPRGRIWGVFRKHKMPAHRIAETWSDAHNFPDEWEKRVKNSATSVDEVMLDEATYYDMKTDTWYFDVLMHVDPQGKDQPRRIVERTMRTSRWLIPRWNKMTGETRGRGPVLQALPEAKSLNKAKELLLKNASVQIFPILTYIDDGIFNAGNFEMEPMSMIQVGYNAGTRGKTLEKLDIGGDLRLTQFVFDEMQMNIKKIMLDDQLPPETGAVKSATEWTARQRELFDSKSAPYGRIFSEFTEPLMETVLDIHQEMKILPDDIKIDGHIFSLEVTSPFGQSQNINRVDALAQFIEITGMLGPEVQQMAVRVEALPGIFADLMALPHKDIIRSEEEIQQMMAQAQEAQQAQVQQEQDMTIEQEAVKQQGAPA